MIMLFTDVDHNLMIWVNSLDLPSFLEQALIYIRNKYFWIPLYVFLMAQLVIKFKKHAWLFILGIAVCMTLSDTMSSKIIKPSVERIRPCNAIPELVINRVDCGSGYSFPSSHATNHFAIAVLLIFIFGPLEKKYIAMFLAWAGAISIAQVFVGVHYPIDILVGALLGSIIGFVIGKIVLNLHKKII